MADDQYDELYARRAARTETSNAAPLLRSLCGDDWLWETGATNWITRTELSRIPSELGIGAGATFVDLGCGNGTPGLWIAEQTGARVIGIDRSQAGCEVARKRAQAKHPGVDAEYRAADMTSTGLPDASVDAVLSIDAVQIMKPRLAAFSEAARILRPYGRFVLTTWDSPGDVTAEALMPDREIVADSRPLLEESGFRVRVQERIPSWPSRAHATYRTILEQRDELAPVVGPALIREAEWGAAHAHRSVHVFFVCERAP